MRKYKETALDKEQHPAGKPLNEREPSFLAHWETAFLFSDVASPNLGATLLNLDPCVNDFANGESLGNPLAVFDNVVSRT